MKNITKLAPVLLALGLAARASAQTVSVVGEIGVSGTVVPMIAPGASIVSSLQLPSVLPLTPVLLPSEGVVIGKPIELPPVRKPHPIELPGDRKPKPFDGVILFPLPKTGIIVAKKPCVAPKADVNAALREAALGREPIRMGKNDGGVVFDGRRDDARDVVLPYAKLL